MKKWRKIQVGKDGHKYMTKEDTCYYYSVYGEDEEIDQLIHNSKPNARISWNQRAKTEKAIAKIFVQGINELYKDEKIALVPMPPSDDRVKNSNRIKRICHYVCAQKEGQCVMADVLIVGRPTMPMHYGTNVSRLELVDRCLDVEWTNEIDETRRHIIVDDVISSGAHYVVASGLMNLEWGIITEGMFLARAPEKSLKQKRVVNPAVYQANASERPVEKKPGALKRVLQKLFGK